MLESERGLQGQLLLLRENWNCLGQVLAQFHHRLDQTDHPVMPRLAAVINRVTVIL